MYSVYIYTQYVYNIHTLYHITYIYIYILYIYRGLMLSLICITVFLLVFDETVLIIVIHCYTYIIDIG